MISADPTMSSQIVTNTALSTNLVSTYYTSTLDSSLIASSSLSPANSTITNTLMTIKSLISTAPNSALSLSSMLLTPSKTSLTAPPPFLTQSIMSFIPSSSLSSSVTSFTPSPPLFSTIMPTPSTLFPSSILSTILAGLIGGVIVAVVCIFTFLLIIVIHRIKKKRVYHSEGRPELPHIATPMQDNPAYSVNTVLAENASVSDYTAYDTIEERAVDQRDNDDDYI